MVATLNHASNVVKDIVELARQATQHNNKKEEIDDESNI